MSIRASRIGVVKKENVTIEGSNDSCWEIVAKCHLRIDSYKVIVGESEGAVEEGDGGGFVLANAEHDIVCAGSVCERLVGYHKGIVALIDQLESGNHFLPNIGS